MVKTDPEKSCEETNLLKAEQRLKKGRLEDTFPCGLVPFALGVVHVTCKQDCIRELEHLSFISALLLESIETALCLLSICLSQSKFQITLTFVLRWIDFIKLHCSFISFILWNPNIASIPVNFFLVGLFVLKCKT